MLVTQTACCTEGREVRLLKSSDPITLYVCIATSSGAPAADSSEPRALCYEEGGLGADAQRVATSFTMAMKYAPLILVIRRSRLAWRVSEIAIQSRPSGCSRITFWYAA